MCALFLSRVGGRRCSTSVAAPVASERPVPLGPAWKRCKVRTGAPEYWAMPEPAWGAIARQAAEKAGVAATRSVTTHRTGSCGASPKPSCRSVQGAVRCNVHAQDRAICGALWRVQLHTGSSEACCSGTCDVPSRAGAMAVHTHLARQWAHRTQGWKGWTVGVSNVAVAAQFWALDLVCVCCGARDGSSHACTV